MSTKEWVAVGLVIGAGVLMPMFGHDDETMDHSAMEMQAAQNSGPMKTVALDVTGMT